MPIKASVRVIKMPEWKLDFTDELLQIAKTVVIPDMQGGINRSIGIDNEPFPALEPSTIAKKKGARKRNDAERRQIKKVTGVTVKSGLLGGGGGTKPLIDTGKLRDSFIFQRTAPNRVTITINSQRDEIAGYLQVIGVGKRKKKFNFFGMSQRAELQAISFMRNSIGQLLKKLNGK